MNNIRNLELGDLIAIKIQKLRMEGKIDGDKTLLKIDYRKEAAKAPFQFDIVNAKIHRTSCNVIPSDSRSALYALWEIPLNEEKYACKKCKPESVKDIKMEKNITSDILFGFMSIIDQFSSVLTERGKEYRNSSQGRKTEHDIENLLTNLDQKQKDAMDIMLLSLDGIVKVINQYNELLQNQNNDHPDNGRPDVGAAKQG